MRQGSRGTLKFGGHNETLPLTNQSRTIPTGTLALAEFDKPENGGNGDGIIDWRDAVYPKLLLWIDANHDGVSQPEELHSLQELGVYSISLSYHEERYTDQFKNWFRYRGALNANPLDGKSTDGRWTYDVFLVPDKTGANCPQENGVAAKPLRDNISTAEHSLN